MTTKEFVLELEGYHGDEETTYTRPQLKAINAWCSKKQGRVLQAVFDVLLGFGPTKYQRLPLVRDMKAAIEEAVEMLPPPPPSGALQLTDGEEDHREEIVKMLNKLVKGKRVPMEEAINE